MIYCQTINKECIAVHPFDDIDDTQYIELIKYGNTPMFSVYIYDGETDWTWEFDMSNPSDYERVKMSIFDVMFGCDSMPQLTETLNDIFESDFENILIVDEFDGFDNYYNIKH